MAAEKSKVIHVRSFGQDVTEDDLNQFAQEFGTVTKVVLLRLKNQALIQMEDVASAERLIDAFAEAQPTIRGRNVYIQFSSHQELKAQENHAPAPREPRERREHPEQRPNRILLITIHNPQYPITVDVLHQVFSPHGLVEKIVTFLKQPAGLQALLQFALQQSAVNARTQLQGRNIYDGCCTLDIQFSNLPELQVNYNSDKTRDYTNQNLPTDQGRGGPQAANMMQQTSLFGDGSVYGVAHHGGPRPHHGGPYGMHQGMHPNIQLPLGVAGTNDRRVVLVSNLNVEQVDPEKLFNLFSNYGNIIRIKMLQKKPDHALIEMAEGFQAELAVHFLKGVMLLGKQMDVNYSKHPHINPTQDAHDFSHSNLNRFSRNASKNFRHCCAPTKMIHCSSLPANVTEESITEYLAPHGTITGSKLSENNGKKQALVLFSSEEEATEALVQKHATKFEGSTIRLAFSKLTSL